jgi:xanthine dehydrogenase accessory factor
MTPRTLAALMAARRSGAVVLATRLSDGLQVMLPHDTDAPVAHTVPIASLRDAAAQAVARDQSEVRELGGQDWFLHVHAPPYRLIVIGAVHIAQALVPLARSMGYGVWVVDPRSSFNSAERFDGATRVHDWPDEALSRLAPDARSAVVALTHDPKLDDPALDRALRSSAGYIGALGSRRSHAARLARLAELGHAPDACARVRGPVGLPLGAVSAPEIALSILAEIVAVRRGAALGQRDRP